MANEIDSFWNSYFRFTDAIPSSSETVTSNANTSSIVGDEGVKLRSEIYGFDEIKQAITQVSDSGSLVSSCPVIPFPPASVSIPSLKETDLINFSL